MSERGHEVMNFTLYFRAAAGAHCCACATVEITMI